MMRHSTYAVLAPIFLAALSLGGCGDEAEKGGGDDDDSSGACMVSASTCVEECISTICGLEVSDCSSNATCDSAKDTMVSCVCSAQRDMNASGVDTCLSTFSTQGGSMALSFATCAKNNCATQCGL